MMVCRHDDNLKWKGTKWDHINVVRIPADQLYVPDVMVYNHVDNHKTKMEWTNALVYPDGNVMWIPPVSHRTLCRFDLRRWPYDENICFIKVGSWTFDGNVLDVQPMSNSTDCAPCSLDTELAFQARKRTQPSDSCRTSGAVRSSKSSS